MIGQGIFQHGPVGPGRSLGRIPQVKHETSPRAASDILHPPTSPPKPAHRPPVPLSPRGGTGGVAVPVALPPAGAVREADAVGQLGGEVVVQVELLDHIAEVVAAGVHVLSQKVEPEQLLLGGVEPETRRQKEIRPITSLEVSHGVYDRH